MKHLERKSRDTEACVRVRVCTSSVMVAENNMVCLLKEHSRMISFICSSKYSSNILRDKHKHAGESPWRPSPLLASATPCLPVGLVQDQDLDVGELEARRVVEVVDQTTRCGDQNVRPRPQRRLLRLQVQPTCRHTGKPEFRVPTQTESRMRQSE